MRRVLEFESRVRVRLAGLSILGVLAGCWALTSTARAQDWTVLDSMPVANSDFDTARHDPELIRRTILAFGLNTRRT